MRYLIGLILCLMLQVSYAKESLPKDCSHLKGVTEADFVLLSKKEFIELGECLAISLIKKRAPLNVVESCSEVDEDRRNILGIFSLSKALIISWALFLFAVAYNVPSLIALYGSISKHSQVFFTSSCNIILSR